MQLSQLIASYPATHAIYVAAKLGIADLVAEVPKTADELADETKSHAPSLSRVLLMLASIGIFSEDAAGRFRVTPLGELLRRDHPQSQRAIAVMYGSAFFWRPWGELYEAVMTGQSAFERVYGKSLFDYLSKHRDDAAIFNDGMSSVSARETSAILAAYDFSRFERIVDIGGGHGALLNAILLANPRVHGVLADQPTVLADIAASPAGSIADRCEIAGVDFFVSVPDAADAYILKYIIHDWDDRDALKILRNCRSAIRSNGRLLLIESVLKPSNEPDPGRGLDLTMLVLAPGGRERTEAQFAKLLDQAGFSLMHVIPTAETLSIVESKPV
jgi:SAM-dependent methyltransferase